MSRTLPVTVAGVLTSGQAEPDAPRQRWRGARPGRGRASSRAGRTDLPTNEPAIDRRLPARPVEEKPSSAANEDGKLEVGGRDAVRCDVDSGSCEDRLPVDELGSGSARRTTIDPRPSLPRARPGSGPVAARDRRAPSRRDRPHRRNAAWRLPGVVGRARPGPPLEQAENASDETRRQRAVSVASVVIGRMLRDHRRPLGSLRPSSNLDHHRQVIAPAGAA